MQFSIGRHYSFRLDRNEYGGDTLLYVRDDILSKLIPITEQLFDWRCFERIEFEKNEMTFMLHL